MGYAHTTLRWTLVCASFLGAPLFGEQSFADPIHLPYMLDLSQSFHTRSDWRLAITQGPGSVTRDDKGYVLYSEEDPIRLCFQRTSEVVCPEMGGLSVEGAMMNDIMRVTISNFGKTPVLLVHGRGTMGIGGWDVTYIWSYRTQTDRFEPIFSDVTGTNNNEETRLLEDGPLAGDIVVAAWTERRYRTRYPYPYAVAVFRRAGTGPYRQILRYLTHTQEGDGNGLPVIDSEMLEIEKRLHVWRPGQPLPQPKDAGDQCKTLEVRDGVEWCR